MALQVAMRWMVATKLVTNAPLFLAFLDLVDLCDILPARRKKSEPLSLPRCNYHDVIAVIIVGRRLRKVVGIIIILYEKLARELSDSGACKGVFQPCMRTSDGARDPLLRRRKKT